MANSPIPSFPLELLQWAGHRAGGVRRLFHEGSGRPSGVVLITPLIQRLDAWAAAVTSGDQDVPRAVLLVGGPGNGKTEAVESTIRQIDVDAGLQGKLIAQLSKDFSGHGGSAVPRKAVIEIPTASKLARSLTIVQDASVGDPSTPEKGPAELLARDLAEHANGSTDALYLACVNRGILDDAFAYAVDFGLTDAASLIDDVIAAVSLSPSAPSCWPLEGRPSVAVWPMDVESLIVSHGAKGIPAPGLQLLDAATESTKWPVGKSCAAQEMCPFCTSRILLAGEPYRSSLVRILRLYELATGKRWTFRDLFSLISLLLAGSQHHGPNNTTSPCAWAAHQLDLDSRATLKGESTRAVFELMAAQYHHALFRHWPRLIGRGLRPLLNDLGLQGDRTLLGLHYFLNSTRASSLPATLDEQLRTMSDVLDPAFADSDQVVMISSQRAVPYREIDARFSHSVKDGLKYLRKFRCLTAIDTLVLERLAETDARLSDSAIRRAKPATADKVQMIVRVFACRVARRSVGARSASINNFDTLNEFQSVIDGNENLMHQAVKQVEALLNANSGFEVTLNTTFGEPMPPIARRAVLATQKQKVRPAAHAAVGRPVENIKFLTIGTGAASQPIALTYDLFKSVKELQAGMLPASLPRTVMALLDTTRARLAGRIVRDEDALDGSEIRVGNRDEVIVRELRRFIVRKEND